MLNSIYKHTYKMSLLIKAKKKKQKKRLTVLP